MAESKFSPKRLPFWLALYAVVLGFSGLLHGPWSFVIFFGVTFGTLLCLRAIVRTRAKRMEARQG